MLENIYNNERIGGGLLKHGLITEDQLKEALEIHKEKGGFLGKILVEKGFLTEEAMLSFFLEQFAVPYVPPSDFPINSESKKFISEETARKYLLLPVDHVGFRLSVICPGPLEVRVLGKALEACKGMPVIYFLGIMSDIEEQIEKIYKQK